MDTYKNTVRVAAHRGNSRYYPENTLIGFRSALELPVDQLEIDLHMCKDGHIVMMHDHTVDRTTNGTGRVRDFTLAQLKELDAGSWKGEEFAGTQIPTFIFYANLPQYVKEAYRRFLENKIRENWTLTGSPINVFIRQK